MGAWFVGAKSNALVYQAEEAMKRYPAECDEFGRDAWLTFLKSRGHWNDEVCAALPTEDLFLDGGGSILIDEPRVGWEANKCSLKTYVRHLPFALEQFRRLKARDANIPGCVGFGGFCRVYVMAEQTVTDSIPIMERLVRGTESLRQELEMSVQQDFNEMEHGLSVRKCGCLSGLMYVECCGKFIETRRHKETRESTGH